MEKHIMGGISYTLGTDGLYYPDLTLPKGTDYQIGKYGKMRADYLKKRRKSMYQELVFAGKWNEYLHEVDEEGHQRIELLMEQMKIDAGITEQLKTTGHAEEIVLKEIVNC